MKDLGKGIVVDNYPFTTKGVNDNVKNKYNSRLACRTAAFKNVSNVLK